MNGTEEVPWWKPISHFLGHVVSGALVFLVVAAVAVVLGLSVRWLGKLDGVPDFTLSVLTWLEHIILIGDATLFLVYIAVSGIKFFKELR
jgi:hypothetical protein